MNELKHLEEFKQVLAAYQTSDESKQVLKNTKLVLLASPSSTGRNTIIRHLVDTGHFYFIVSDTTRKPRINDGVPEKDGVHYKFRDEAGMLDDLKNGEFLEAAIIHNQQVSGISIRELKKARDHQKYAVTDIEVVGVDNIIKAKPDAIAIFVLPPSFEEWQRRLKSRGDLDEKEYRNRMKSADKELTEALKHDYYKFVINDDLQTAIAEIDSIAKTTRIDPEYQVAARLLAQELHQKIQTHNQTL